MIELLHISKKYGNKVAVSDLHLIIPRGELFAFLGPNGAGKTTTIKMMCGLLFPTTGMIRIAGDVIIPGFDFCVVENTLAKDGPNVKCLTRVPTHAQELAWSK